MICLSIEIGSQLTRKRGDGPAKVHVVGVRAGRWIVADIAHGSPFELTPNELRVQYGGDGSSPPEPDELSARARFTSDRLDESVNAARAVERVQAESLTPEQAFSAAAESVEK